jgi:hypothetical protein
MRSPLTGSGQILVNLLFLRKMQAQDGIEAVQEPLQFQQGMTLRSVGRHGLYQALQPSSQVEYLAVRPAHAGRGVVAAKQLGKHGVHVTVIGTLMRQQLFL